MSQILLFNLMPFCATRVGRGGNCLPAVVDFGRGIIDQGASAARTHAVNWASSDLTKDW